MQGVLDGIPFGLVLIAGICAPLAGWFAARRLRHPGVWFVLGALIGPLALVLLALAPPGRCPACDTPVRGWAEWCEGCGRRLPNTAWSGQLEPRPSAEARAERVQEPARSVPAESPPVRSVPVASVPARSVPAASVPVASVPARSVPAKSVPAKSVPVRSVPVASVPAKSVSARSVPAKSVPAESVPAKSVSARSVPAKSPPTASVPAALPRERVSGRRGSARAIEAPTASTPPRPIAPPPTPAVAAVSGPADQKAVDVLSTGVYLSGNVGLQVGATYALARAGDHFRIFGPVDVGQLTVRHEGPIEEYEVVAVGERVVITGRGRHSSLAMLLWLVGGMRAADLERALSRADPSQTDSP